MYILPTHKERIKEVMRSISVNRGHLSRNVLNAYKKEFRYFMHLYPGIDFKQITITK
jgi:hypothetical protein